jgi:hypothetical protein
MERERTFLVTLRAFHPWAWLWLILIFLSFSPEKPPTPQLLRDRQSHWKNQHLEFFEIPISTGPPSAGLPVETYWLIRDSLSGQKLEYAYSGRVNTCRAGACFNQASQTPGMEVEFFEYYMLMDTGFHIRKVRIFNYQASHGHEVMAKGWLNQFKGLGAGKEPLVGKNIDGISGATVSVYALTFDVGFRSAELQEYLEKANLRLPDPTAGSPP